MYVGMYDDGVGTDTHIFPPNSREIFHQFLSRNIVGKQLTNSSPIKIDARIEETVPARVVFFFNLV